MAKKPPPPKKLRGAAAQAEHDKQRAAVRGDTVVSGTARQAKDAALAYGDVTAPEDPDTRTGRTSSKNPAQNSAPKKGEPLQWSDVESPGAEWLAPVKGEPVPARIRKSSRNSDGSHSFFCYRNAEAVAVRHSLEDAKRACEIGRQGKLSDEVLKYVTNHPLEIPPFLALTDGERRAIRAQYPYAAPPQSRVDRAVDRGAAADPGTRKLLAELAARESASGGGQRSTRAAKRDALADPSARLTLPLAGTANPAKPGTKRHAGYEVLLSAARQGHTVQQYLDAGGKDLRLAKAVRTGLVELKKGEK